MGGLKPIGSEKLEGMDKIRRIMEIARYNENTPNPINENKKDVYTAELADGKSYSIVKEKGGYIIKENINESETDYIEPIQNRKYFSSYSQALKRLNLISKELNALNDNDEGMSLFTEQKKKYKLKVNKKKQTSDNEGSELPPPPVDDMGGDDLPPPPVDDMGDMGGGELPPPPADMGGELPPPPADDMGDMGGELPPPPVDDMGGMDDEELPPPPMDDMDEEDSDDDGEKKSKKEGGPSFKIIQKLTGKLAQKIRKYNTKDEMDSNDVKYIINSILSALDVDVLDDDDLEEIINRLEGDYEEGEDEDFDKEMEDIESMDDEDMSEPPMDDMGDEDLPEPPEGGEIEETMNLGNAINAAVTGHYSGEMQEKLRGMDAVSGELDEYGMRGARKPRHTYGETNEFKHLKHGTFGESKVDKIISSYFKESTSEKVNKTKKNIRSLSENIAQERLALKFVEKHPKSKMLGKLRSGDLVFESKSIKYKITPEAKVI